MTRRTRTLTAIGLAMLAVTGGMLAFLTMRDDVRAARNEVTAGPPVAPSAPLAAEAGALRTLFGDVVNEDGAPIAGATVQARLSNGRIETRATDDEGTFVLDGLSGTSIVDVSFSATGFVRAVVLGSALPTLAEAHWSQKLVKSNERPLGIGGAVVDERGAPVTAFRLVIMPRDGDERAKRRGTRVEPINDARGVFERADVSEAVSVQILAPRFRPYALDMKPGDRARISLERSNVLRGRITDRETGAPVLGATVSLDGMRTIGTSTTSADGSYVIDTLPIEKVSVNVRADGYLPLTLGGVEGGRSRDEVLDAKLSRATEGMRIEVVGIGVTVGRHQDGVLVRGVLESGPAHGSLDDGDIIVEADGVVLAGRPLRESMAAIRGEPGTTVRLRVKKAENGSTRDLSLERARVTVPEG